MTASIHAVRTIHSISSYHYLCIVSCPTGIQRLSCDTDPCVMAQCTNHPDAYCVTENCGLCSHRFYNSTGNDVTDECGNIIPLLTIIHLHACR